VNGNGSVAYLDSSAFVKLVLAEPESWALRRYLHGWPRWASATLVRTEALRALRRHAWRHVAPARRLLATITLLRLDDPLLDRAADLEPPELRSLDAVHVAAALSLGPDLGVLVTYDDRLADAARLQGLEVSRPL
jgi:predicted nucleic acid-binding protein